MPRKKELSFEENMERLEKIVASMEAGDLALTDLMKNYSDGIELSKKCMDVLERAEQMMDLLVTDEKNVIKEEPLKIEEK